MNTPLHVDTRDAAGIANGALPLVYLHGWGMNLRVFDTLRDALPEHQSIALDLPGHGRSDWSNARATFDAQVDDVFAVLPPRCILLGWSLGGKFALELARRAPQTVQGLVLVSATPKFAQSVDWPQGLDADSMAAFGCLLEQDWRHTLSDFVWLQLRGSRNAEATQRVLEAALAAHGAPQLEALQQGLSYLSTLDLRAAIPEIRQPALVIAGQHDRVTPAAASLWLANTLPNGRFQEIPRAGHASFISHVDEFAALLRPFLADLAARQASA